MTIEMFGRISVCGERIDFAVPDKDGGFRYMVSIYGDGIKMGGIAIYKLEQEVGFFEKWWRSCGPTYSISVKDGEKMMFRDTGIEIRGS